MTIVDTCTATMPQAVNDDLFGSGWCQRTTHRKPTWRHTSEGGFNAKRYEVRRVPWKDAVAFIQAHHYSGTRGSMKLWYGLIDRWADELVGVVVLGIPMHENVLTNPLPNLVPYYESADLNRLVLLDEVPSNGESFLVGAALRHARKNHNIKAVVTFADPVPRPGTGMGGHVGDCYRAMKACYAGRADSNEAIIVLPDNTILPDRSMSKVRKNESGAQGVIARLVGLGATPPHPKQTGAQWLKQALAELNVMRFEHPGVHRFLFLPGSERERKKIQIGVGFEHRPYPMHPDPIPTYR